MRVVMRSLSAVVLLLVARINLLTADCGLQTAACRIPLCSGWPVMSTLQVSEKTARLCASVAAPAPIFEVFDGTMLPIAEMPSGMTSNLQNGMCTVYWVLNCTAH